MLRRCATVAMFLILGAAFAIVYLPSLRIGFVTDDFHMLCKPAFTPSPQWYRYSPVGLSFWHLLAGPEKPEPFRIVALVLHAVNTLLVVALGARLTRSVMAGAAAGLIFFAQRQLHQVVFWNSAGFFYMPMTAAVLVGCLVATRPPSPRPWAAVRYLVAYPLLSALSAFSHESGIYFLPAVAGLELLGTSGRGRNLKQWTGAVLCFLPTAIPPLILLFIKSHYCQPLQMNLDAQTFAAALVHSVAVVFGMVVHVTPPGIYLAGKALLVAAAAVSVVGGIVLIAVACHPCTRQLVGLAVALLLVPFTSRLCTWVQDRFLYMPTALFAVFSVALVVGLQQAWLYRASVRRSESDAGSRVAPILVAVAVIVVCAFAVRETRALIHLRNDWQTISERTDRLIRNIIAEVDRHEGRSVQAVHLVNPPILFSETNLLPFHPVIGFPHGLTHGVWLTMRRQWRHDSENRHKPVLPRIVLSPSEEQSQELKRLAEDPGQLVITFDGVSTEPVRTSGMAETVSRDQDSPPGQ